MFKIFPLDYYRLTNSAHFSLMLIFKSSLKGYPIVSETFPKAVELFLEAFENEAHAIRQTHTPSLSPEIHDADLEQIRYFRMLRDWAKLKQKDDDAAIVEAADPIVKLSNSVGGSGINSLTIEERSAGIYLFVQRLEEDWFNEVQTLDIQHFLDQLKEANHRFRELYMERIFSYAETERGQKVTKRARRNCDFAIKTLFSMINDKLRLGEGEDFIPFVKLVNVEIDKNRITLGQGPGDRKPRRKKEEKQE